MNTNQCREAGGIVCSDIPDPLPNAPGCYIRYPSGCPKQKHRPKYNLLQIKSSWKRDNFRGASDDSQKCSARKQQVNNWCGVDDIIVEYVNVTEELTRKEVFLITKNAFRE